MKTKNRKNKFPAFCLILASGWPEGVEPSTSGPQPDVLPLNYGHHTLKFRLVSPVGIEPTSQP